jgi:hypothetical protein
MFPSSSFAENPADHPTYVNRLTPVNPTGYPNIELDGPLSFHNSGDITTTVANFGLTIGTNVEAHSALLDKLAANSGSVDLSGLSLALPSVFVVNSGTQNIFGTLNLAAGGGISTAAGSSVDLTNAILHLATVDVLAAADGGGNSISVTGTDITLQNTAGATINVQLNGSQTGTFLITLPLMAANAILLTDQSTIGAFANLAADTAGVTNNTATDLGVSVTVPAGTWPIEWYLKLTSSSATPGFSFSLVGNNSFTLAGEEHVCNSGAAGLFYEDDINSSVSSVSRTLTGQTDGWYRFRGTITLTTTTTLKLQYAQQTTDSHAVIAKAGAYIFIDQP